MRKNVVRFVGAALLASAAMGCTVTVRSGKAPPPAQPSPPARPKLKARPMLRALRVNVTDNRVELPGPVLFTEDQATLKPESEAVLEMVYQYLQQNPRVTKHRVEGHTDTDGDDARNMDLSRLRALAVAHWLVAKGISCNRLIAVGFGETKLKVNPEVTSDDKATNRRVDFVNAELDGKAIGALPLDGGGQIAGDVCH